MKFKILCLFFIISCMSLFGLPSISKEPLVTADNISVSSKGYEGVDFVFRIRVENDNSAAINMENSTWQFWVNNTVYETGKIEKMKIPGNSFKYFAIPVTINYDSLYEKNSSLVKIENGECKLKASLEFQLPVFGTKKYDISMNSPISLLKRPVAEIKSIELISMEPDQISMAINYKLINKNQFSVSIEDFYYELFVNGNQWSNGMTKKKIFLESESEKNIAINISVRNEALISEIYNAVISSDDINFQGNGTFTAVSPMSGIEKVGIPYEISGTSKIRL